MSLGEKVKDIKASVQLTSKAEIEGHPQAAEATRARLAKEK